MTTNSGGIWVCQEVFVAFLEVLFHNSSTARKAKGIIKIISIVAKNPIYLVTPQSRGLLKKVTGPQLLKKLPTFYGIRRFITVFTRACPS
jgi:hypothetical protein